MKIEIWADVTCPWCALGLHRLDRALAAFPHRDQVEIVHHSFQLDPDASETPQSVHDMMKKKHGMADAEFHTSTASIEALAAADGLTPFHVADNVVANTSLAHELLALAVEHRLSEPSWKRLYRAYFGEQRPIFDVESLVELGTEIGLPPEEVREALTDRRYRDKVLADVQAAQALGSTGVPFVVIDQHFSVAGAQSIDVFREALERAWREQPQTVVVA
jgi:predicted DsbA family dithiol-disulfide isomerase